MTRNGIVTVSTRSEPMESDTGTAQAERKRRDTERGGTERRRRDATSPHGGTRTPHNVFTQPSDSHSMVVMTLCLKLFPPEQQV